METLDRSQALNALNDGFGLLCRKVGNESDFLNLDQFPASVFCSLDYEFLIQQTYMQIGGTVIDVPESIDSYEALKKGAVYYAPNLLNIDHPSEISNTPRNELVLRNLIHQKLLHYSSESAIDHTYGLIGINGGLVELCQPIIIEKRERKTKTESKAEMITAEDPPTLVSTPSEFIGEVIEVEKTENESNPDSIIQPETQSTSQPKSIEADNSATAQTEPEDTQVQDQSFTYINQVTNANTALINSLGRIEVEIKHDLKLFESSKNNLLEIVQNHIQTVEYAQYETMLNYLLNHVSEATTPKAVNSVVKQTTSWTTEQRAPLLSAVHKRIAELNPIESAESTFIVRINRAESVADLDEIYLEVKNLEPELHERLASYMNQKRSDIDATMFK